MRLAMCNMEFSPFSILNSFSLPEQLAIFALLILCAVSSGFLHILSQHSMYLLKLIGLYVL